MRGNENASNSKFTKPASQQTILYIFVAISTYHFSRHGMNNTFLIRVWIVTYIQSRGTAFPLMLLLASGTRVAQYIHHYVVCIPHTTELYLVWEEGEDYWLLAHFALLSSMHVGYIVIFCLVLYWCRQLDSRAHSLLVRNSTGSTSNQW
jgi:hypothetical protein